MTSLFRDIRTYAFSKSGLVYGLSGRGRTHLNLTRRPVFAAMSTIVVLSISANFATKFLPLHREHPIYPAFSRGVFTDFSLTRYQQKII